MRSRTGGTPTDVVRRFLDELQAGTDRAAIAALVSDPGLRTRVTSFHTAFPDLRVATHLLIARDDLVAVHLTGRATHQGTFQGVPPTGRPWSATCTAIYRVTDGRISESWVDWDKLAIVEQIGGFTRVATASA